MEGHDLTKLALPVNPRVNESNYPVLFATLARITLQPLYMMNLNT